MADDGSAFQTAGAARNSVGRAVFLSKGQACRGVLLNEDLPATGLQTLLKYGRQNCAHGHSQTQRCYFELYSLWQPMKHDSKGRNFAVRPFFDAEYLRNG